MPNKTTSLNALFSKAFFVLRLLMKVNFQRIIETKNADTWCRHSVQLFRGGNWRNWLKYFQE